MEETGQAVVFTCAVLEVLNIDPTVCVWSVDLRDRPEARDPTVPEGRDAWWDEILTRLRGALEEQRRNLPAKPKMVASLLHRVSGGEVRSLFRVPFPLDVARFLRKPPPTGRWLLLSRADLDGATTSTADLASRLWWAEEIPF